MIRRANDIIYVDSDGKEHHLSALECLESKPGKGGQPGENGEPEKEAEKETTTFRWITSFHLKANNVMTIANSGGRLRWKIENEGFNVQKNGGYALEHAYSEDEVAGKVFYFLLQLAHLLFQLTAKGSLFKQAFPNGLGSLKKMAQRLLEAWRNLCLSAASFLALENRRVRISFYNST